MRSQLRGAIGVTVGLVVLALAAPGIARAQAEDSLLGIHLGASYKEVIRKYGPPKYVQLDEFNKQEMLSHEEGSGNYAGSASNGMSTAPSAGGGPSIPSLPRNTSGKMGMMMGGMTAPGGPEGPTGPMGAGASAPSNMPVNEKVVTWGQPTRATVWIYNLPKHTFFFKFDKTGKVIEIQSFGRNAESKSAKGVALGASLETMLRKYGWTRDFEAPDSIPANMSKMASDTMTFDYRGFEGTKVRFYLSQIEDSKSAQVIGIGIGR